MTPIRIRVDDGMGAVAAALLADHRRARAAASPADPAATPWEPSRSTSAAAASRSASVDASTNRTLGLCEPTPFPEGADARSGSTPAVAPGTSLSSRLSVTGVTGSTAAGLRSTGMPSTSTAPPTTRPALDRKGRAEHDDGSGTARGPRVEARRAAGRPPSRASWSRSSRTTGRSPAPPGSHARRQYRPPPCRPGRPGDTGDHGEQRGALVDDVRPRGGAAQHVRGPTLCRELRSRIGGAGQVVGHQAHQPWSHEDPPRQGTRTSRRNSEHEALCAHLPRTARPLHGSRRTRVRRRAGASGGVAMDPSR